jgi:ADP-ribosyl-[dinitrogen reductase] hydrolase
MRGVRTAKETLLGLAVGDALGAPLEFDNPEKASANVASGLEMTGGGPFGWMPGEWTDDTALALCLAEGLVAGGLPPDFNEIAQRYGAWADSGPKDIGATTAAALRGINSSDDARSNARAYAERTGKSAGNGALMRVAPLALTPLPLPELVEAAREDARLTHWDDSAADASATFCLALRALIDGDDPFAAAEAVTQSAKIAEAVEIGRVSDRNAAAVLAGGPEFGTCWAALAAALTALDFEDYESGINWTISLGKDTDTNAAIAGALLGCRGGMKQIPRHWLDPLLERERIEAAAAGLEALA